MHRLPKDLLADPRHDAVVHLLESNAAVLFEEGQHSVARVQVTKALAEVLRGALFTGQAAQGLETITDKLASEQKGLDAAQANSNQAPPNARVSRLLFLASDGSKRFYRDAEGLLNRYQERLLLLQVDLPGPELGAALFGKEKLVRSVLVFDKTVAARALLALLPA